MKNIFKTLALALPLLATSLMAVQTEGNNDLLSQESTTFKVIRYYGDDAVMARVKAENDGKSQIAKFPVDGTLTDAGWQNDDEKRTALKTFIGNVEVNRDDFLRMAAPYNTDPVAYTLLAPTEEPDADLTVGSTVTVLAVKNWKRPDGTTYSRVGEALFRLHLEEERTAVPGEFKILKGSRGELQRRGFNSKMRTRYTIDNCNQTKVVRTTTKLPVEGETMMENPTIVEYIALIHTGSYESWDNESGRGQGNIPAGYQIGG